MQPVWMKTWSGFFMLKLNDVAEQNEITKFVLLFTSWASREVVFTSYVSSRWDDGKITEALVRFSAFTSTRFNFPLLKTAGKDFCIFLKINLNCGSSIWEGGMKTKWNNDPLRFTRKFLSCKGLQRHYKFLLFSARQTREFFSFPFMSQFCILDW